MPTRMPVVSVVGARLVPRVTRPRSTGQRSSERGAPLPRPRTWLALLHVSRGTPLHSPRTWLAHIHGPRGAPFHGPRTWLALSVPSIYRHHPFGNLGVWHAASALDAPAVEERARNVAQPAGQHTRLQPGARGVRAALMARDGPAEHPRGIQGKLGGVARHFA